MNSISEFQPQWISSPGETIKDILHEKNLSIDNFATIMGSNNEQIKKLLSGYVPITEDISNKLSKNIGGTPEFWLRRERQYRTVANKLRRQEEEAWLRELPISDMVKLGWLPANMASKAETCLEYFEVPNVKTWRDKYAVELGFAACAYCLTV
jgi:HTH-type transcriptional regulator/antitoxin HigA